MSQSESITQPTPVEQRRRQILMRCEEVAPLPDTVAKVLALLNDPDADAATVERAMADDPILVARLLAIANSAFFATGHRITTIPQALVHIGFAGVRNLVLAASVSPHLRQDYRVFGYASRGLWQHSVAVAAGARHLAECSKVSGKVRDELFVAGLLHDLGKMVLVQFLDPKVHGGEFFDAEHERALLGIDHAEAGALVAAKWNLGSSLEELIARHHDRADAKTDALARARAILRVSHDLAEERKVGYESDRTRESKWGDADLDQLELSEEWPEIKLAMSEAIDQALAAISDLD